MNKITLIKSWHKWRKWQVLDVYGETDTPTNNSVDTIRAEWLIYKEMAKTGTHSRTRVNKVDDIERVIIDVSGNVSMTDPTEEG